MRSQKMRHTASGSTVKSRTKFAKSSHSQPLELTAYMKRKKVPWLELVFYSSRLPRSRFGNNAQERH